MDLVVERVDVDGALRRLVLQNVVDDLARHAREPTVDVEAELEALAAIRQLKLPRDNFFEVFPQLRTGLVKLPTGEMVHCVLRHDNVVRCNDLIVTPAHLRLHEVGEVSGRLFKLIRVIQLGRRLVLNNLQSLLLIIELLLLFFLPLKLAIIRQLRLLLEKLRKKVLSIALRALQHLLRRLPDLPLQVVIARIILILVLLFHIGLRLHLQLVDLEQLALKHRQRSRIQVLGLVLNRACPELRLYLGKVAAGLERLLR